jgi:hypothetical protein
MVLALLLLLGELLLSIFGLFGVDLYCSFVCLRFKPLDGASFDFSARSFAWSFFQLLESSVNSTGAIASAWC